MEENKGYPIHVIHYEDITMVYFIIKNEFREEEKIKIGDKIKFIIFRIKGASSHLSGLFLITAIFTID
jgi:Cu/Ag efflux protein CusF